MNESLKILLRTSTKRVPTLVAGPGVTQHHLINRAVEDDAQASWTKIRAARRATKGANISFDEVFQHIKDKRTMRLKGNNPNAGTASMSTDTVMSSWPGPTDSINQAESQQISKGFRAKRSNSAAMLYCGENRDRRLSKESAEVAKERQAPPLTPLTLAEAVEPREKSDSDVVSLSHVVARDVSPDPSPALDAKAPEME